jgi:hypothetical protein
MLHVSIHILLLRKPCEKRMSDTVRGFLQHPTYKFVQTSNKAVSAASVFIIRKNISELQCKDHKETGKGDIPADK